ncbi:MAG: tRNA (adenosine(37)-N6)-threonylcarbamoyltransferase complex ATPase subunit type 1 TsaE, partial [Oceanospirillaceae bacterium]|nr:tRNA (adenosine(37)-N6)-threonylcarbamoyltransferase complex ATPase subunit type 1 TsaE [Oceanospirillaceae bacterium]
YFDEQSINLIEWPDKGQGFLPAADIELTITSADRGRCLNFVAISDVGCALVQQLQAAAP